MYSIWLQRSIVHLSVFRSRYGAFRQKWGPICCRRGSTVERIEQDARKYVHKVGRRTAQPTANRFKPRVNHCLGKTLFVKLWITNV